MDLLSKTLVNAAMKTGGSSLSSLADAMGSGPSRIGMMIQAFAPASAVSWFQGRRLRVRQVKAQEQMFDEVCEAVLKSGVKQLERLSKSGDGFEDAPTRLALEAIQSDMRVLSTFRDAVRICDDKPLLSDSGAQPSNAAHAHEAEKESLKHREDAAWWDMFESLARRRNEPWRQELLAKALVEYDRIPGSICLKAIWEIGMMENDDFGCLAAFCDSALHIDGKPVVLIEPDRQAKFRFEDADAVREINLAHAVSALIDAGLVAQAATQFNTNEPVRLEHLNGPTWFIHQHADQAADASHEIQINGFFVNDIALDICRLYEPTLNIASNANFEEFQTLMTEAAKEQPEVLGKVKFQKRKPATLKRQSSKQ
jgi:hypothetical protein